MGMRALVTGLSTYWGGRVAQALEQRTDVDVVVGVDSRDPRTPLERTEFVRTDSSHSILSRIVRATQVDTIVHTHLVVDSTRTTSRMLHEINVIGTMNLLAAAGAPGSPVRKVVLKSSGLVYGAGKCDPYFFREEMTRTGPGDHPRRAFAARGRGVRARLRRRQPSRDVSLLRFANVLGVDIDTPFTPRFGVRSVPEILGFDPRLQFVHEDDVVGALMYAIDNDIPGVYNVAADGMLPWSEVCAIVGKRRAPLPFAFTNLAAEPAPPLRLWDLPPEAMDLLRFGRSHRQHALQARGVPLRIHDRYDGRGLLAGACGSRARSATLASYRYEREVEDFFRHSPAVVRPD